MIEVRDVTKRFGTTVALDNVSFSIEKGGILGFLGPNGAGKSTAMKIITTFLAADSGSVKVDGMDVMDNPLAVRSRIGYLPENNPLYEDMLVNEYLDFVGHARGLSGNTLKQRLEWVVEASGIANVYHKPINELSKGYKQRTGLAQALIHDPDILILDEPTSGLDPLQIIGIRELIQSLAHHKTIIFSTHILQEVSPVTDRVVIINNGRIIADGMISELEQDAMESNRLFISLRADAAESSRAIKEIPSIRSAELLLETDGVCRFEVRGDFNHDLSSDLSSLARSKQWDLLELHESRFSLEDTFIALTKRNREDREVSHV
jgi:gliding motility-associated transport system ATP-binding protein